MEALAALLNVAESAVLAAGAVFVRISAMAYMMPGFGERMIPARIKLGVALAFAAVLWPMIVPTAPELTMTLDSAGAVYAAELASGAALGLALRFLIFALQTAGTLIAQHLSIVQMFGAGVAPEPEPSFATILTLGGIALALSLGLHVKIAALLAESYAVLPFGVFPLGSDMAAWSTARASQAFSLAVSLAMPFILVAFVYNLALGAINRAMPQLMVAFIGLPAITWLGIGLLFLTAGAALQVWHVQLDEALAEPFGI